MQGYWDVKNPSLKDIEDAINQYSELGLELQLTEWTIPVASETEDGFSLNVNDTNTSRLYDKDFNPKPAYYGIQDVFMMYY